MSISKEESLKCQLIANSWYSVRRTAETTERKVGRLLLSQHQYSFKIKDNIAWQNPADGLSRVLVEGSETEPGASVEDNAYLVLKNSVHAAMTAKQIERQSAEYPLLPEVRRGVQHDNWTNLEHTVFNAVRDESWIVAQIVTRKSGTKVRLREKVWWPRLDTNFESIVMHGCYPCQLVSARPHPEPIRSTTLPQGPWHDIVINMGHCQKEKVF